MQSPFDSQDDIGRPLNGNAHAPNTKSQRTIARSSGTTAFVSSEPGYLQLVVCVAGIYASL